MNYLAPLLKFLYKFYLVHNLWRKSKSVRQRFFVIIFDIYYVTLKILTYVMSYTDNITGKIVINICAHLGSFTPISACLGSFRFIQASLSLFRYIWAHLGSFRLI